MISEILDRIILLLRCNLQIAENYDKRNFFVWIYYIK